MPQQQSSKMGEQKYWFEKQNHFANLNNMRLAGQLCDVTIKVNDKEFQAHKNILAPSLKYFELMFLNSFQESNQDVITLKNMQEIDVETFISFAYTGKILITDSNALNLLEVANYFSEDSIKQACIDFLEKHMEEKDACRAYHIANAIECFSLKNMARQVILTHFESCSQTEEYFDFDFECLKEILCDANSISELQQSYFEGIMRWILYNAESRRGHVNDLLNLVDIMKLDAGHLIEYLCEVTKKHSEIAKSIMFFYQKKRQEIGNRQSLMIIRFDDELNMMLNFDVKLNMQFYNFTTKKWGRCREMECLKVQMTGSWAITDNEFFYAYHDGSTSANCLGVFNFSKQKMLTLACDSSILRESAMCYCTKTLYFCGGLKKNGMSSDQFIKYNLESNKFETLPPMETKLWGATAIFYQGYLHVLGGVCGVSPQLTVEKYDPITNKWLIFPSMKCSRYHFGVAVLDGKLYACGGVHCNTVEVYDPKTKSWQLLASMNKVRYNFLLVTYEGKLFAFGGDGEKTVEVYDPNKDQWTIDELSAGLLLQHVVGGFIPASDEH